MADPNEFFDRMKHLKPEHNLDPEHDALWIKCPKEKEVASLVKAYKKRYPGGGEIVLRHDFQVIEEKTKVNVLTTRPPHNFIALEAVRTQELETRKTAIITATLNRAPLTEVTNTASLTRSKSLSTPKDDSRPVFKAYSPRIIRPATSSPSMGQHVSSQSPTSLPQPDQIGWEDFLFERLELHRQNVEYGRQTAQRHHSAYACDKSSQAEWLTLSEGQKSYFVERGKRIRSTSNSIDLPTQRLEHGAFWRFYYDGYFAVKAKTGTDPHHDFDEQRRRMEEWVNQWNNWNLTARKLLMDRVQVHITSALGRGIFDNLPKSNTTRSSLSRLDNAPSLKREMSPSLQTVKDASPQDDTVKKEEDLHGEAETGSREAGSAFVPLSMSELFDGRTPEQLEKSVEKGVQLLGDIQRTLQAQPSQDATQWLQALEKVHKQAVRSKTVIGVVGATGAGKSSVINAMLDEERLVPTNCMRACTAVVTEISYNYEDGAPYKAQIEFISRDDWQKMLKVMFQDLIDGSGQVSHECTNEDSESGIAYAQVKAVYPKLTKEEMEKVPIERLMEHDNVACLGTTRTIEADDALVFYKKLQQYVDSKEKNSALKEKGEKEKKKPWEMEFWPLIRVVRLHVKAPALATGAVIVDLPGVHDSNQARAAVAQGYMKQCTGLWIVAPITRAVDDKSAKNLLGDSFKRQLKMDGGYNAVTFICSKTDDISITEAQDSLGLEEELGPMWTKWDELRQKKTSLKRKIEGLKETKSDISAAMEAADEELEVWEKLQEQSSAGQEVFMPKPKSQKRKRVGKPSKPRKKVNYADPDTEDDLDQQSDDVDSDAGSDYASSNTSDDQREPLTEDDITNKITELRITKKEGRHERNKVDEEIKILRRQIEEVDKENEAIDALLSGKCISGRNEYSRGAIRQDYASGIRELDQELAEEADAAIFNPEVDARDYDEVARNLPVFCVSSRAYQKLKGRLPRDKMPPGFNHIDETEVPALQAHCIQLTGADRQASCRRFLNSMFQLLNSLRLWASNDGTGKNLSEGQLQREGQILNDRLTKLDSALEKTVTNLINGLAEELQDKVYDVYPTATAAAISQANDTVRKWGMPVNRDNRPAGGLYWATYKAVVRRDGCFTGSGGCHNFNEQLVEPVIRHIAGAWESVFARRMPGILNGLPLNAGRVLTEFHDDIERRAVRTGASIASFQMLKHQIPVYKETLKDAMAEARGKITEKQRDINREFEPQISAHMLEVYGTCTSECGPGSFARMKAHMDHYVADEKHSMFEEAVSHVRELLQKMLNEVKEDLLTKLDAIFMAIKRDYTGVVIGQEQGKRTELLPRDQRALRKAVLENVDGAELIFKRALGLEPEPLPDHRNEDTVKLETSEGIQHEIPEQVNDVAAPKHEIKEENAADKLQGAAHGDLSIEEPVQVNRDTTEADGDDVRMENV